MHYYELDFPGRGFTVLMHRALIDALRREALRALAQERPLETGGLLLGRANEGAAIISNFLPLLSRKIARDKKQFIKQFASRLQDQELEILGFYRITSRVASGPEERDLQIMREFLPETASMFLLIGASQEGNAGSLFVWDEKDRQQLLASKTKLQLPNSPGDSDRSRAEQAFPDARDDNKLVAVNRQNRSRQSAGINAFKRMLRATQTACRSPLVWVLTIGIAGILFWHQNSPPPSRSQILQVSAVQQKAKPLALEAKIENGRLRVTWDASSPLLVSAESAVLSVDVGNGTPDAQVLGRDRLMAGAMIFPAPQGHVKVRLSLFTQAMIEAGVQSNKGAISGQVVQATSAAEPDRIALNPKKPTRQEERFRADNSPASADAPSARFKTERREGEMKPMNIGFTEEPWLDRFASAPAASDHYRIPPRPIHLAQPDRYYSLYPFTIDSVQVNIRVKINASGKVTSAESLVSGNALLGYLSGIAVKAASASTFVPAQLGDRSVPSTAVLSFLFLRKK